MVRAGILFIQFIWDSVKVSVFPNWIEFAASKTDSTTEKYKLTSLTEEEININYTAESKTKKIESESRINSGIELNNGALNE